MASQLNVMPLRRHIEGHMVLNDIAIAKFSQTSEIAESIAPSRSSREFHEGMDSRVIDCARGTTTMGWVPRGISKERCVRSRNDGGCGGGVIR